MRGVRLVSLCPSITETLAALGLARDLVGVTRYCTRPKAALRGVRRVGGTKNPDLAAIRAAEPDLVFCNAEENRAADIEALRCEFAVDVSHPRTVGEIPALLRHIGALTRREKESEEISSKVEAALARIEGEARPVVGDAGGVGGAAGASPASARFRFVYLIWRDPWMTVGPRTYVADLLRRVGGVLAFEESSEGGAPDYPVTSEDEIVASHPDVLLLPDEPYPFGERDAVFWRGRLPASCRVFPVSGDDFCWHGVRTLRGLEAAGQIARQVAGSRT